MDSGYTSKGLPRLQKVIIQRLIDEAETSHSGGTLLDKMIDIGKEDPLIAKTMLGFVQASENPLYTAKALITLYKLLEDQAEALRKQLQDYSNQAKN